MLLIVASLATDALERGLATWHESCPIAEIDGLCMTRLDTNNRRPLGCNGEFATVGPVARDAVKRKDALATLAVAIHDFDAAPDADFRALRAAAGAVLIDADLEAFLVDGPPDNLDFNATKPDVRRTSVRAFQTWTVAKQNALGALISAYRAVGGVLGPERVALATELFADEIGGSPVPVRFRNDPDGADAYCDAMATEAGKLPIEQRYVDCLNGATSSSTFDDAAHVCERALHRLDPVHYPLNNERRAVPTRSSPIDDVELP